MLISWLDNIDLNIFDIIIRVLAEIAHFYRIYYTLFNVAFTTTDLQYDDK